MFGWRKVHLNILRKTSLIAGMGIFVLISFVGIAQAAPTASVAVKFTVDDIPPASITDLVASPGINVGEIALAWTTPGDDGWVRQLTGPPYTVKYDTRSVAELGDSTTSWWEQAAYTYPQGWAALAPGEWDDDPTLHYLAGLTPGTMYYIAIRATDNVGNEALNNNVASAMPFDFNDPPDAPTNLGPPNYVDGSWGNDNTPTLEFTQSDPNLSDTLKYTIQIDTNSDFSSPVVNFTSVLLLQGTTSYTVPDPAPLPDGSYYWRVMSIDNSGASSGWSTANDGDIAFKIDTIPPADPTLVLSDQTTGSTSYTDSPTVDVVVGNDSDAAAWLISETQPTQPAEDDPDWGSEPVTFTLSSGDGLKTVYIWVKDAAGNINPGPVSATITLDTIGPVIYQITSDVLRAKTTEAFKLTIELVDSDTLMPISGADNPFIITACTVGGEDAPGNWIKISGPSVLSDGRAEIRVSYDTAGKIRFKVSDDFGHPEAYTDVIEIEPVGLRYHLEAPGTVQAGEEFPLKVKLIDIGAGNLVTPSEYARQVKLVAYSSPVGTPAEGELKIKSFYLQGGEKTLLQSYSLAHIIYIEASDAKVYDPPVTSDPPDRTADIEVIGVPKTVMRFDGICREMHDEIYLRSSTRIIIMSVTDIVAETILYRDNGAGWKTYVEPFTLSPGAHTIEYYGIDKYEHKERINRSKKIYVTFFGGGVVNIPNPFQAGREETWIEYDLKEPSNVTITIYDLFGQEVWHKNYAAGENGGKKVDNSVSWDGRNLSGKVVANGGYICRIWVEKEKRHMVRKIAVAK